MSPRDFFDDWRPTVDLNQIYIDGLAAELSITEQNIRSVLVADRASDLRMHVGLFQRKVFPTVEACCTRGQGNLRMKHLCPICGNDANDEMPLHLRYVEGKVFLCGDCLSGLPGAIVAALMGYYAESKL
jgi:hypothetical protein